MAASPVDFLYKKAATRQPAGCRGMSQAFGWSAIRFENRSPGQGQIRASVFDIELRAKLAVHAAAMLAALPTLSGLLLTALVLSALSGLALAALLLLTGLLLAALLRIVLLLLRVALWILLFVRHLDVLHGFWKPPVQRHDNPRTLIAVPRGFAHIFGNELENHMKIRIFRSARQLSSSAA
jgi:hypothetical protein